MAKKKVVILGGGVSAVTVAMQLTDDPGWRDQFESITIYQLGWRLGGKGATGRAGDANRILEHGLHIWLGFYENAFQLIQKVYADARRPPDSPIPTWETAFTGQNYVGVEESRDGEWRPWLFYVQPNDAIPGAGQVLTLLDCLQQLAGWIKAKWDELRMRADQLGSRLGAILLEFAPQLADETRIEDRIVTLCRLIEAIWQSLPADEQPSAELSRLLLLIEMGSTILYGLNAEGIQTYDDLEKLEGIDFSRWLTKYSAQAWIGDLTANPLLRGMYDFAFAYENGDVDRPNFAAAPALRTIFRMGLTFKGSIFYKMNAGMGDTIFAPAYEALRNRGVEIKFFHKVKKLELSADKSRVARIRMGRQATVKSGDYQPFVPVVVDDPTGRSPLPCWPGEPIYDQLVEGEAMRQSHADLESFWSAWPDVDVALEADKDFDVAVFGISLGSVPFVCQELVAASPAWADMVAKVATVSTQSVQLWLKPAIAQLGWTDASPILDAWIEPLDTWADMTNVMGCESWRGGRPGSLAYFCGPMVGGIPDQSDQGFPARAKSEVDAAADAMLRSDIQTLWPSVGAGGMLAGDVVARHTRANVDPSERYVQSLAGSAQYRLSANASGFGNLVITGDWIRTGYNAGCVEGAVWGGMQAANTILGRPLNEGVFTG